MPLGFLSEAVPRPEFAELYDAREPPTAEYRQRTDKNFRDSDATLWPGSAEAPPPALAIEWNSFFCWCSIIFEIGGRGLERMPTRHAAFGAQVLVGIGRGWGSPYFDPGGLEADAWFWRSTASRSLESIEAQAGRLGFDPGIERLSWKNPLFSLPLYYPLALNYPLVMHGNDAQCRALYFAAKC